MSILSASLIYLSALVCTQNPPPPEKTDKAPPSGPSYTVKKEPFKIEVSLDGVFESEQAVEVVLQPEAWSDLSVLEAVELGAAVKKGDVLVKLDLKKINEAIQDLESARPLAQIALAQAEEEVRSLEKTLPLDLALAERSRRIAEEELLRFVEKDRAFNEKSAQMDLKNSRNHLEYEQEELRQLEKMYKADDLTEETEEIVLKRQRDSVEMATFYLERSKRSHDYSMNVELPRQDENVKETARRQTLALERARETLPAQLRRRTLELEKLKQDQAKADERLEKLKKDRDLLTVRSPAEGVVYYGRSARGAWPGAAGMAESLRRGGMLRGNEVILTIVKPKVSFARLTVPEKELQHMKSGLEGKASPAGYPEMKLPVKLEFIAGIPFTPGSFDARASVGAASEAGALMPGMSCSVRFVPYAKRDAITVPVGAVFTDELDEDKVFVFVHKDGKTERRSVKAGRKNVKKAEILEGLADGDVVLLENPEEKK